MKTFIGSILGAGLTFTFALQLGFGLAAAVFGSVVGFCYGICRR